MVRKLGWKQRFQTVGKGIGKKMKNIDWKTIGRKAKNTLRDIHHGIQDAAGIVEPYAGAVAAGATALGQPEVAAPAAAITAAAHVIKHR